jgi:spermidine synthase
LKSLPTRFSTLKRTNERAIIQVIIATGISSVVTQLVTIREFITQFQGNEIVIALILFNWLILGASGTFAARAITHRWWPATIRRLGRLSLWLSGFSSLQILAVRSLRDVIFVRGSSVGFYPTWLYAFFTIAPYCLLLGFLLPYSLFVLRQADPDYPGARVYITDNIGDISGGALFSFALVYLVTPLQAILLAHLPMLAAIYFLFPVSQRRRTHAFLAPGLVAAVLLAGVFLEKHTLTPSEGRLAYYRETRYGRLTVHQNREQFTLFEDGIPVFSNQNLSIAEETIHYPLAQLDQVNHVLLISAEGGVMEELRKYPLQSVDYVELDPELSALQFRFGLLKKIPGLHVIHRDGRALLADSKTSYNAIIVNLPEPETFQINRFYTDRFFALAKAHLLPGGVLSFSMQGFDNYLAEPQREKLSSLYNTVSAYFKHVVLLPGQKVFFLCSDRPIQTDIPAALAKKGITTTYIRGFYYGNLTAERIDRLNRQIDPSIPANRDNFPFLLRVMFSQWFAKYQSSPVVFIMAIGVLTLIYLVRISREEFVLFSTGAMTMGGEILVIFAFQIFFGYIYLQIGIIITVFLAGLLPGAWFGQRLRRHGKAVLAFADILLILLLGVLILALNKGGDRLPAGFFLIFGLAVSLLCGFQFPVTLYLRGSDNAAATRTFSADLIGAACGTLFTSTVLIPYFGIIWATAGLMGLKLFSLTLIATGRTQMGMKPKESL